MPDARRPLSIYQQADLVDGIAHHCIMRDGSVAKETHTTLTVQEVDDLKHLAHRLRMIAPHENEIRKLVTGK